MRCLPPQNKPEPAEVKQYNTYLAVLRALGLRAKDYGFRHGAQHRLPNGMMLYDSYHCSRYNTQTKRLNESMFHEVFGAITGYLHSLDQSSRN